MSASAISFGGNKALDVLRQSAPKVLQGTGAAAVVAGTKAGAAGVLAAIAAAPVAAIVGGAAVIGGVGYLVYKQCNKDKKA